MFSFFVTESGRFGVENYLAHRGGMLRGRINVVMYDALPTLTRIPLGGAVFAALDQLQPASRDGAQHVADRLAAAGTRILNQPRAVLGRFDLLTTLFGTGANVFRARRAGEGCGGLRFPVFIRSDRRHSGSHTELLHDRASVDAALAQLLVRGRDLDDLLIVEFCDTMGSDGLYRKYSAMRIGGTIIPRHLHVGHEWVVKSQSSVVNEALIREELAYIETDPHQRWLQQVFDLAHIEYGRIDYGVYRGAPQVWEINTNPTFARGAGVSGESRREVYAHLRDASREEINRRTLAAFASLEIPGTARSVDIDMPAALTERLLDEARAGERAARRRRARDTMMQNRAAQAVKSVLRPALTAVVGLRVRIRRAWR